MTLQRPTQRFDRDQMLTAVGLSVSLGCGALAVAHLLLVIAGGR